MGVIVPLYSLFAVIDFIGTSNYNANKNLFRSISSHGSLRKRKNSTESHNSLKEKPTDTGRLIEDEETETGSVKWEIYKHYIQSVGVFLTVASLFLTFAFQAFEVGANLWLTKWANDPTSTEDSRRDMYLGVYGGFGLAQGNIQRNISEDILKTWFQTFSCIRVSRLLDDWTRLPSLS